MREGKNSVWKEDEPEEEASHRCGRVSIIWSNDGWGDGTQLQLMVLHKLP